MKGVTLDNLNQNLRSYTDQIVKPLIAKGVSNNGNNGGSSENGNTSIIDKFDNENILKNISFSNWDYLVGEGLPNVSGYNYVFVRGEHPSNNLTYPRDYEKYWWNNFIGFHVGFIEKATNKKLMFIKKRSSESVDASKYKVALFYCRDKMYYNGFDDSINDEYPFPTEGDWYDNIEDYTHELILVRELCEMKDIEDYIYDKNYNNKGINVIKTHSALTGYDYNSYFIEGEIDSSERESWNTYFEGYHLGFLNKETNEITPFITEDDDDDDFEVCVYYSEDDTYNGSGGSNNFTLIDTIVDAVPVINNFKPTIEWLNEDDIYTVPNYGDRSATTYKKTFVIDDEMYSVCANNSFENSALVRFSYGNWELVKAYDASTNFNPFGIESIIKTSDGNLLLAMYTNYVVKLNPNTKEIVSSYDFSTISGQSAGQIRSYVISPTTGTIVMQYTYNSGKSVELYRSTDNGATWTKFYTYEKDTYGLVYPIFSSSGNLLLGLDKDGLYYSNDDCVTVTPTNIGVTGNNDIFMHYSFIEQAGRIITTTNIGNMYVSYNNGITWEKVETEITFFAIKELSDGTLLALSNTGKSNNISLVVYKQRNANDLTSWYKTTELKNINGNSNTNKNRIIELPDNEILISSNNVRTSGNIGNLGVFASKDGGRTFKNNTFEGALKGSHSIWWFNDMIIFSNLENGSGNTYTSQTRGTFMFFTPESIGFFQ